MWNYFRNKVGGFFSVQYYIHDTFLTFFDPILSAAFSSLHRLASRATISRTPEQCGYWLEYILFFFVEEYRHRFFTFEYINRALRVSNSTLFFFFLHVTAEILIVYHSAALVTRSMNNLLFYSTNLFWLTACLSFFVLRYLYTTQFKII